MRFWLCLSHWLSWSSWGGWDFWLHQGIGRNLQRVFLYKDAKVGSVLNLLTKYSVILHSFVGHPHSIPQHESLLAAACGVRLRTSLREPLNAIIECVMYKHCLSECCTADSWMTKGKWDHWDCTDPTLTWKLSPHFWYDFSCSLVVLQLPSSLHYFLNLWKF